MAKKARLKQRKQIKSNNISQKHFILAGIIVFTFIIYSLTFSNGFVSWDDPDMVTANKQVQTPFSLTNVIDIFTPGTAFNEYQPLTTLAYHVTHSIWGLSASAFHFMGLLFHLINIILVFKFIELLFKNFKVSLAVATLFAVNPLNVEAVAWISALNYTLFAVFFLLSLINYIKYLQSDFQKKYVYYSIAFFVLSLLAKSTAVVLPLVLLCIDFFYRRKINFRLLIEKVPFFVLAVGMGMIALMLKKETFSTVTVITYPFSDRIFFAFYAVAMFVLKILLPINLKIVYSYPDKSAGFLPIEYYVLPLLVIFITVLLYILLKKQRRLLVFCTLFFVANIIIISHIIPFYHVAIIAERYVYLAAIGVFIFIVHLVFMFYENFHSYKNYATVLLTLYMVFLSFTTFLRVKVWENNLVLYGDLIKKNPSEAVAYNNRGDALGNLDKDKAALKDFDKAIELKPEYYDAFNNRGIIKNRLGKHEEAIADCNKALEINPEYAKAYFNRGVAKESLDNFAEAIQDYSKAIEINSEYVNAYNNRGILYAKQENYALAMNDFVKVEKIDGNSYDVFRNKGNVYVVTNKIPEACAEFRKAKEKGDPMAQELLHIHCK